MVARIRRLVEAEHRSDTAHVREAGLPIRELLRILRRRRRAILCVVVVLTSVATFIGLRVTKTYTATAQVMIEPGDSQIINVEKIAQGLSLGDAAIIETQESRPVEFAPTPCLV
jgi:uncharacterized protein involved in exopolysaccharide biosynthesis